MLRKNLLLFFTLLNFINVNAEKLTLLDKPIWVKSIDPLTSGKKTPESGFSTYVNLYDHQIYFNNSKIQNYTHIASQVLNYQGLEKLGKIEINYDPSYQTLLIHGVVIIRNDAKVNALNTNKFEIIRREMDLSKGIYNGQETAFIILKDLQVKDIVEYSYTIIGQNPIFNDKLFDVLSTEWSVPLGYLYLSVTIPKDLNINFKYYKTQITPKLRNSKGLKTYIWQKKNLNAINSEGNYPRWYIPSSYLELSEFQNWNQVALWATNVFNIEQTLNSSLKQQVSEWMQRALSDKERIELALKFVQEEIRYMGIELGVNSHQPRTPNLTYETKFGDCKDKTVLLKALLSEMGIESNPALVSTSLNYGLKDRLPSPILFNHVILTVKNNKNRFWLDPTITSQGTSLTTNSLPDYGFALLVNKNTRKLMKINRLNSQINSKTIKEEFNSDLNQGVYNLHIETLNYGEFAEYWRRGLQDNNTTQISKQFESFTMRYYPQAESVNDVIFDDLQNQNKLLSRESYVLKNLWKPQGRYETFETYASGISEYVELPYRLNRNSPLQLNHPIEITHTFIISNSKNIIDNDQRYIEIKTNNLIYTRTYLKENSTIYVTHKYKSLSDTIKVNDLENHFKNLRKIKQSLSLILVRQMDFEESIKSSENRLKDALRLMLDEVGSQ